MADPAIVACTADTWVKVATGVTAAQIWIKDLQPTLYLHTYRMTTNPAPSDDADAIPFYNKVLLVENAAAIDVYVKAVGETGSVRVDL